MSTYNTDKKYLSQSIESILNQNYKNIEFIIVCDGSEDEYKYIKSNFNDKRIKLILHKKNMGLPYSLNEGIANSKGKYIARMDDENPRIEICGMYAECFGDFSGINKIYYLKPNEIECQMLFIPMLIHPTVMFSKSFFNRNLYYDEKFKCAQDFDLWTRSVKSDNIAIIPKVGLMYRIHSTQAGQKKRNIQIEFTKKILKRNAKKIVNTNTNNIYIQSIINMLEIFYGLEELNKDNYLDIGILIKKIVKENKNFNKKSLKKTLFNRYVSLIIKNKLFLKCFDYRIFNIVFNFENFKFFIWKISNQII